MAVGATVARPSAGPMARLFDNCTSALVAVADSAWVDDSRGPRVVTAAQRR